MRKELVDRLITYRDRDGVRFQIDAQLIGSGVSVIRQTAGPLLTPSEMIKRLSVVNVRDLLLEVEPVPLVISHDLQHGVDFSEEQWAFSNQGKLEAIQPAGFDADSDIAEALAAYETMPKTKDIVVAIIDTGANLNHPKLRGKIWQNTSEIPYNNIDDDMNGFVDDTHGWDFVRDSNSINDYGGANGHGTPVAGVISSRRTGTSPITGVAPDAKLMILNVGIRGQLLDFPSILEAFQYAVANGADIINMSFGHDTDSRLFLNMIYDAFWVGKRIYMVASAGNDNRSVVKFRQYPCVYTGVICVGSSNAEDQKAAHSNYGTGGPNLPIGVTIAAPGEKLALLSASGGTFYANGTSFAAPLVSGTLALLRAARPQEPFLDTRARLLEGADHIRKLDNVVDSSWKNYNIGRRLNAYRSLVMSKIKLKDADYCEKKADNGARRFNNFPYANFGDAAIDGSDFSKAFTICTKRQLLSIRESDREKFFKLRSDIYWDEKTHLGGLSMVGQNWRYAFDGSFSGDGFSIYNIEEKLSSEWGLFKSLGPNSSVVHLNLRQFDVEAGKMSGALSPVGKGLINFVHAEGKIVSLRNAGGLLGEADEARIMNSAFEGTVRSLNGDAGGLVSVAKNKAQITNAAVRADVIGKRAGGVVGYMKTGAEVNSVFAFGNIKGDSHSGGIVARLEDGGVQNAMVEGQIHGAAASGIVSKMSDSFVAYNYSLAKTLPAPDGGGAVGTIMDKKPWPSSLVLSVYYLKSPGTLVGSAGEAKDWVELLDRSTFDGWNFRSIWYPPNNNPQSPRLKRNPRSVGAYHPDH